MERKAHQIFQRVGAFRHNTLLDEADAMAAQHIDEERWYELPRDSRIFMTARFVARRLMDAMQADDQAEELKRKREARGGKSPRRSPVRSRPRRRR